MPTTSEWFRKLGFGIWHTPGVSRAWRYEFAGGSYVLITNLDGFDLPEVTGPYSALLMSATDELIEYQSFLQTTRHLINWFQHASRLIARH